METDEEWVSLPANICLSGGAEGADLQFGMVAGWAGHQVFHFIFEGHRSKAPNSEKIVLSPEQLSVADPHLVVANKTLRRKWPVRNPFTANLLRRNYYQVSDAEAVYAISTIDDSGMVAGGTSWAVQMFLDRFDSRGDLPAYVYDQNTQDWLSWQSGGWEPNRSVPVPTGVWAGIGSRDLKDCGKNAIRDLFSYRT